MYLFWTLEIYGSYILRSQEVHYSYLTWDISLPLKMATTQRMRWYPISSIDMMESPQQRPNHPPADPIKDNPDTFQQWRWRWWWWWWWSSSSWFSWMIPVIGFLNQVVCVLVLTGHCCVLFLFVFYHFFYQVVCVWVLTGHWALMDFMGMGLCVAFIAFVRS